MAIMVIAPMRVAVAGLKKVVRPLPNNIAKVTEPAEAIQITNRERRGIFIFLIP